MTVMALIEPSGRIADVRPVPHPVAAPLRWVAVPEGTTTQDVWDGQRVVKHVAFPSPAPTTITPRQFWLGCLADGDLTPAEVESGSQGAMPASIATALAGLPEVDQVAARVTLRTMKEVRRDDSLTALFAGARGLTDAQVDDRFRRWSQL